MASGRLRGGRGSPILGIACLEIGAHRFRIQVQHLGVSRNNVGQVGAPGQLQILTVL